MRQKTIVLYPTTVDLLLDTGSLILSSHCEQSIPLLSCHLFSSASIVMDFERVWDTSLYIKSSALLLASPSLIRRLKRGLSNVAY
jgi:hypothetical protein